MKASDLKTPKRWLPIAVGALLLLTLISWMRGPEGMAVGTWVVAEEDLVNYLRDHWGGPQFSGVAGSAANLVADIDVEIELEGDGSYVVTTTWVTTLLGKSFGDGLVLQETGRWELLDADFEGGRIRFEPASYDLVKPKERDLEEALRRAAAQGPQRREFTWETVDSNTLLWRPVGVSTGTNPVRIRRK